MKKLLLFDCSIDIPWIMGETFKPFFESTVIEVRRAPQNDFPTSLASFSHVLISGSKTSCLDSAAWIDNLCNLILECSEKNIPLLGVCFGHQIVARAVATLFKKDITKVLRKAPKPEKGMYSITQTGEFPLFAGLARDFSSMQSHVEEVVEGAGLPLEFYAKSQNCPTQALRWKEKKIFGIQFHPEKKTPAHCFFESSKADLKYNKDVAPKIFQNFISL